MSTLVYFFRTSYTLFWKQPVNFPLRDCNRAGILNLRDEIEWMFLTGTELSFESRSDDAEGSLRNDRNSNPGDYCMIKKVTHCNSTLVMVCLYTPTSDYSRRILHGFLLAQELWCSEQDGWNFYRHCVKKFVISFTMRWLFQIKLAFYCSYHFDLLPHWRCDFAKLLSQVKGSSGKLGY